MLIVCTNRSRNENRNRNRNRHALVNKHRANKHQANKHQANKRSNIQYQFVGMAA